MRFLVGTHPLISPRTYIASRISLEKAKKLVGYQPLVSFEEGFAANIEWFRDDWDMIKKLADFPPGMSSAVRDAGNISTLSRKPQKDAKSA